MRSEPDCSDLTIHIQYRIECVRLIYSAIVMMDLLQSCLELVRVVPPIMLFMSEYHLVLNACTHYDHMNHP